MHPTNFAHNDLSYNFAQKSKQHIPMKLQNIFQLLLVSLVIISCKNEKTSDATTPSPVTAAPAAIPNFRVTINAMAKTKDDFQVYYSEMPGENFSEEKSVWSHFEGSNDPQDVVLNLPAGVLPTNIRIDMGMQPDQSDIIINNIMIENGPEKFTIQRAEIPTYFSAMEPTTFDPASGVIKNMKDGKKVEPVLQPLPPLTDVLAKITAAK